MAYLQPTDYTNYGLPATTTADWVTAATALINSFCRRPDLNVIQYIERLRLTAGSQSVYLSYLPLAPLAPSASPIVCLEGRYAQPRRGELPDNPLQEIAQAFGLPGQWVSIDPTAIDFDPANGELRLPFNEVRVTYTAGLSIIGDDVKSACAQIIRNAQAQPALNTSKSQIDTMHLQYFSSSLVDETVQAWLRPYIANRLG